MNKPLVSVIVPAYKVEKYLDKCVESIVEQTYKNLEIILVDDGSPDNCPSMCDSWAQKDSRIKVIHKENGGVSSARNAGIDAAEGEFIGFVDSDDWLEPDMYECLVENALKYDADISRCGYYVDWPDHTSYVGGMESKITLPDEIEARCEMLETYHGTAALWNKIYRAALFDSLRIDESMKITEDWYINYILLRRSKRTVYDAICKYHYIMHGDNATKSYNRSGNMDMLKTISFFEEQENGDPQTADHFVFGYTITALTVMNHMISAGDISCDEYKKAAKCVLKYKKKMLHGNSDIRLKLMILIISLSPKLYAKIYDIALKRKGGE